MKKLFFLLVIIIPLLSKAQTLGGFFIKGYLVSAEIPNCLNPKFIAGPPDDSMWVNLPPGEIMTGNFSSASIDLPGYDLLIQDAFNLPCYNIRLKLTEGRFSSYKLICYGWLDSMWIDLHELRPCTYAYLWNGTCKEFYENTMNSRILPLDYKNDFLLTPSDTVIGIEITFTGSDDDLYGVYLIGDCQSVNLGNDTTLCEGESLKLNVTAEESEYLWNDSSTSGFKTVTKPGKYWVSVKRPCGTSSDTINVQYVNKPLLSLGNDTVLCKGETLNFDLSSLNSSYLWNDESTNPTYTITEEGIYWVKVSKENCSISDTIQVEVPRINLGKDTILCEGESLSLKVDVRNASFLWQDGSTNPNYLVSKSGLYWLDLKSSHCLLIDSINITFNDCSIILEMPNIFSPNNDGINDYFKPIKINNIINAELSVFNKWGQKVFYANNLIENWDGKTQGKDMDDETYFWIINYIGSDQKKYHLNGFVQLIR